MTAIALAAFLALQAAPADAAAPAAQPAAPARQASPPDAPAERPRRGEGGGRWRPDGPMPAEMMDRVIAVARDVSPDLARQLEERRSQAPEAMSQAMRQSARRLMALAVVKDRNPALYAVRVEDLRLQLELRDLGEAFRATSAAGDSDRAIAIAAQIAAKARAQVDVDLKARAQELLALDEQMKAMREELLEEEKRTEDRVAERIAAAKEGRAVQERVPFGEAGRRPAPRGDGDPDAPRGDPARRPG